MSLLMNWRDEWETEFRALRCTRCGRKVTPAEIRVEWCLACAGGILKHKRSHRLRPPQESFDIEAYKEKDNEALGR